MFLRQLIISGNIKDSLPLMLVTPLDECDSKGHTVLESLIAHWFDQANEISDEMENRYKKIITDLAEAGATINRSNIDKIFNESKKDKLRKADIIISIRKALTSTELKSVEIPIPSPLPNPKSQGNMFYSPCHPNPDWRFPTAKPQDEKPKPSPTNNVAHIIERLNSQRITTTTAPVARSKEEAKEDYVEEFLNKPQEQQKQQTDAIETENYLLEFAIQQQLASSLNIESGPERPPEESKPFTIPDPLDDQLVEPTPFTAPIEVPRSLLFETFASIAPMVRPYCQLRSSL